MSPKKLLVHSLKICICIPDSMASWTVACLYLNVYSHQEKLLVCIYCTYTINYNKGWEFTPSGDGKSHPLLRTYWSKKPPLNKDGIAPSILSLVVLHVKRFLALWRPCVTYFFLTAEARDSYFSFEALWRPCVAYFSPLQRQGSHIFFWCSMASTWRLFVSPTALG